MTTNERKHCSVGALVMNLFMPDVVLVALDGKENGVQLPLNLVKLFELLASPVRCEFQGGVARRAQSQPRGIAISSDLMKRQDKVINRRIVIHEVDNIGFLFDAD